MARVDPATGRGRLRNLLNRLRRACGAAHRARRGGPAARARASRSTPTPSSAPPRRAGGPRGGAGGLARTALARYSGDLLPADRYAPWAAEPRERLRQRYLELLDALAADARERGDLDEAVRLLERGIAAEPLDEARHLAAAELLLRQGRRGAAGALVERAAAVRTTSAWSRARAWSACAPPRAPDPHAEQDVRAPLDVRWTPSCDPPSVIVTIVLRLVGERLEAGELVGRVAARLPR